MYIFIVAANGQALDETDSINSVIDLINVLGGATPALEAYKKVLNGENINTAGGGEFAGPEHYKEQAQKEYEKFMKKFNKKLGKKTGKQLELSDGTHKNKDKNTGSNSSKDKQATLIDWIEQKLKKLQDVIDETDSKLSNLFNVSDSSVSKRNKLLQKEVDFYGRLVKSYGVAATDYEKEAENVIKHGVLTNKTITKTVKGRGGKKNKVSVVKRVRKGKLSKPERDEVKKRLNNKTLSSKTPLSELIKYYGEDKAKTIQEYIDYMDKARNASKNLEDAKAKQRQKRQEQEQNKQEYAESKISELESKKDYATSAKKKNKYLQDEVTYINASYNAQIAIAGLENDKAKQQQLETERQKKLRDLQIEQHQNIQDELETLSSLQDAQKNSVNTAREKNSILDQQKSTQVSIYNEMIEIAKLQGDTNKANQLAIELNKKLLEIEEEKFNNISKEYENNISLIEISNRQLENSISELEARELKFSNEMYTAQRSNQEAKKQIYKEELTSLLAQQNNIEKGTQDWYDNKSAIQSVRDNISSCSQEIIKLDKAIRNVKWDFLENAKTSFNLINDELELAVTLMNGKDFVNKGIFTDEGTAALGSYYTELQNISKEAEIAKSNLAEEKKRYDALPDGVEKEQAQKEYNKHYSEYIDLIKSEKDMQNSIVDLMKDKYQSELDYLKELIDNRKELLNTEKEAYEYQKSIAQKTQSIAILQKQIQAISGDDSEGATSRIQQLKVQLDEANKDLQDTEYEKFISDTENMLDKLVNEYSEFIEEHLKNIEALLEGATTYLTNSDVGKNFGDVITQYFNKYRFTPDEKTKNFLTRLGEDGGILSSINNTTDSILYYLNHVEKDKDAASDVIKAISDIGDVNSDGFQDRLLKAQLAYDGLTESQKSYVSNIDSLHSANASSITKQQSEAQAAQAAQAAAQAQAEQNAINRENEMRRDDVKNWIKGVKKNSNYVITEKKPSSTQEFISDKVYSIKGKYLTSTAMSQLDNYLKGKYGLRGTLLDKLKGIGFSHGGVIGTLNKVPLANHDDAWITVGKGERVLTPMQNEGWEKLTENLGNMNLMMDSLKSISNIPALPTQNIGSNTMNGDVNISFNLPGVTNSKEFMKELQADPKFEKMIKAMVWDTNSLTKYNQKW